ncbi:MAG: biopolymer transporter ExbD [Alcanivorax sp.]|jgi:biopolymer transport protein ExbD|nr:biopolymer transporter ExbD [Alcanivorax sp.]
MNLESPDSGRRPPLEPVLPLINVVFLLLIFFMVAGQLAPRPEGDVDAPDSASADTEENLEQFMLVLDKEGRLLHQGEPVAPARIADLIRAHRRAAADTTDAADTSAPDAAPSADTDGPQPVRLMADADTALSTLRDSLETLRDAGVEEVRLVTRSKNTP